MLFPCSEVCLPYDAVMGHGEIQKSKRKPIRFSNEYKMICITFLQVAVTVTESLH